MNALVWLLLSLPVWPSPWCARDGDPPPLRELPLASAPPEGLKLEAKFAGTRRRFGQIRFGSSASIRVAVVVDEVAAGKRVLYVDANRDRIITERDRLPGDGPEWRARLAAKIEDGEKENSVERNVLFRMGTSGIVLGYATVDAIDAEVELEGKKLKVRRRDGDGNGLFADERDRVWFDLDGDGAEDALRESFLWRPVLEILGRRFVLASDAFGKTISLRPLVGTGKVKLALPGVRLPKDRKLEEVPLTVTLSSKDGVVVGLHTVGEEVEVPKGEYRVTNLELTLPDPAGGLPWCYTFSTNGGRDDAPWRKIEGADPVVLDPVGMLDFRHGLGGDGERKAGDHLRVDPRLFTEDGLLITSCGRGESVSRFDFGGPGADIVLLDDAGKQLGKERTGFA